MKVPRSLKKYVLNDSVEEIKATIKCLNVHRLLVAVFNLSRFEINLLNMSNFYVTSIKIKKILKL